MIMQTPAASVTGFAFVRIRALLFTRCYKLARCYHFDRIRGLYNLSARVKADIV